MPVTVGRFSLGTPPQVQIQRGPRAGEFRPQHEVIIPGWQDVIHIRPISDYSPEEKQEYFSRVFRSLERSPTPEVVRNFARIGQAIDDVQDGAVTLSVLGRVITKVAGRVLPLVGPITTIADALSYLNIFYPKTAVRAGAGAVVAAGEKLSGRRKYLMRREFKRQLGLTSYRDLTGYLRRLSETSNTGRLGFGYGEALQILQTSEELTGYGLSLGPIFGGMSDAFWGFIRGARYDFSGAMNQLVPRYTEDQLEAMRRFAPAEYEAVSRIEEPRRYQVTFDWPGVVPMVDLIMGRPPGSFERDTEIVLGPLVDPINRGIAATNRAVATVSRTVANAARQVWNDTKFLLGLRRDLPWDVHVELLAYQSLALNVYGEFLRAGSWGDAGAAVAQQVEAEPVIPFYGPVRGDQVGKVAAFLRDNVARRPFEWLNDVPAGDAREFAVSLVDGFATGVLESFEGPYAEVEEESSPAWRSVWLMHEYDLLPPYDREDFETEDYLEGLEELDEEAEEELAEYEDVLALFLESFPGVELEEFSETGV